MPSLESEPLWRLQRRVLTPLTGGVALDERTAGALFREPPSGTIAERWHIYGAGYFARLSESLEDDYPAVQRVVGRDAFRSMVRRYVLAHTPRSYDLGRAGDRLAGFLGTDWLTTKLPFLPDLAQLEWKLAEAFVSEDARPLRWEDLQAMEPERVSKMPLHLMPGTVVLRSEWPLIELWECKDRSDHEVSVELQGRRSIVLVYRRGYEAYCTSASETTARVVESVGAGATLFGIQESFGADGDPAATREILRAFRRMVGDGLLRQPDAMSVVS